ncbi:bifunctional riboflavin kinase/FAD synthetase [Phocicoccus pinnipedialis]|uniref:Riboflavin biosynthesis protein n=1 Tax=Phocicoccus pinnipedialis TaxID=110845 RepID=A0A6V7RFV9_9BACL|nr:bifunctional riboflavin kinase/FAD synthetase [Jeotgalicoccus pinnipedialis]MBP1939126.1 riboflavin kinase/FMN adenylyltransferase [Jeotgalicoccus pinnipedialis]CAD2076691.1 Riboflavin biosynthesis protein RibF [Jeotgalicoccus pinnipedialis]
MEVIRLQYPNEFKINENENIAIALGFFDGLHIGHQKVINKMIEIADKKGLKKAVLTFDPHPSVVLNPKQQRTTYITPLPIKERILEEYGVDYLFVINFSSTFAKLSPETFVREYLIGNNVKEVIAGFDFSYGSLGKGSISTLEQYKEFNTTSIVKEIDHEKKISTTRIRKLLSEDKLEEANRLLGRSYGIEGIVVQGEKRGRTIGFPTANIEPSFKYFLPSLGVYAVTMTIGSDPKIYKGVASIGVKPTFHENHKVTIEVHIIDYDQTIYGETVMVYWEHFIRHELKFDGLDALIEAIQDDKNKAIELLKDK